MTEFEPLIISAPFGNYLRPRGTTATIGTFTALRRGGRPAALGRAALTLRYYRRLDAWVNRIGLRNPGIDSLARNPRHGPPVGESILSVHGFDAAEWTLLLDRARRLRPIAVELNISCPNVGEITWPESLFADAVATGLPVIVKVPPVRFEGAVDAAVSAGVPWIHATNTLPVAKGGMSGAPLLPLAVNTVQWIRARHGSAVSIIGGGGIRTPHDIALFASAGADRFAIGTYALRLAAVSGDRWVQDIRAAAQALATPTASPDPRDQAIRP